MWKHFGFGDKRQSTESCLFRSPNALTPSSALLPHCAASVPVGSLLRQLMRGKKGITAPGSMQRAGEGGVNRKEWAASSLRVSNREMDGIPQPDPKRKNWL